MGTETTTQTFERYLIYPNESIDRLTVNRPLQRFYEDIDKKRENGSLVLSSATSSRYGTARFSSLTSFSITGETANPETSSVYLTGILNPLHVDDFSKSFSDNMGRNVLYGYHEVEEGRNGYWVKSECGDVEFISLPNGLEMITGTYELGVSDVVTTFGEASAMTLSGDISNPSTVSGYVDHLVFTDEDIKNIEEYALANDTPSSYNVTSLLKLDGKNLELAFNDTYSATLRHNICDWTTYSSFSQSYVELHYSAKMSVNSLYEGKYGKDEFVEFNGNALPKETSKHRHQCPKFEQKPMVMMQLGFYNGDSAKKPVFGYDDRQFAESENRSEFHEYNTLTNSPITENDDSPSVSPIVGNVMVKKIENKYDYNGKIADTIIHYDVVMKFMVGSEADPMMIHGLTTINAKAKLQFAIIGI